MQMSPVNNRIFVFCPVRKSAANRSTPATIKGTPKSHPKNNMANFFV